MRDPIDQLAEIRGLLKKDWECMDPHCGACAILDEIDGVCNEDNYESRQMVDD